MNKRSVAVWAVVLAAVAAIAHADQPKTGWHLIVAKDATRTAVRMSDGEVSDVKIGSGERALGPNMAGATRTVSHVASPDGKRILYEMEPDGKPGAHFIALADADGKNFRRIGSEGSSIRPTWSVDGRQLAFLSKRKDQKNAWHVYRTDVASGEETKISREPVESSCRPSFAFDGRLIYVVDDGSDIRCVMDLVISDGEKETKLITKNYVLASAASPDGLRLAAVVPNELIIRDLKTGQVQTFPIKDVNPTWRVSFNELMWRPDNQLALNFHFLGDLEQGARVEGDDYVAVMSFEAAKPAIKTHRVGTEQKLYAWITDADLTRTK